LEGAEDQDHERTRSRDRGRRGTRRRPRPRAERRARCRATRRLAHAIPLGLCASRPARPLTGNPPERTLPGAVATMLKPPRTDDLVQTLYAAAMPSDDA